MGFTNETIELTGPSINELSLQAISPKYRTINITLNLLLTAIAMLVLSILPLDVITQTEDWDWMQNNSVWLYIAIGALGSLFVIYHFFADPIIQYAVREHDVHFQTGLFFRKFISQPILRVQHIELKRGPIERKFGLATLQVFSAGGISHTFEIPGLEYVLQSYISFSKLSFS